MKKLLRPEIRDEIAVALQEMSKQHEMTYTQFINLLVKERWQVEHPEEPIEVNNEPV